MESLDSHAFHGKVKNCLMWRYPTFAGFADLPDLFLAHLRAAGKHGACFTSRREQVPRSEGAVIRRLDFIAPKLAPCPSFFFAQLSPSQKRRLPTISSQVANCASCMY